LNFFSSPATEAFISNVVPKMLHLSSLTDFMFSYGMSNEFGCKWRISSGVLRTVQIKENWVH
jgi:hypothetical protein